MADAAAVDHLAATTLERFGRVDVLCNNAGVSTFNLFRDQTLDDWRWVFDVNLWGVVHGLHSFVPIMREQGTPRPHRQHRVHRRPAQRRRVHRPLLRHQGRGGVDLRDAGPGARDRRGADRRERALPELRRHPGHGVRAGTPGGARREHRTELAESVRLTIRDSFTGPTGLTPEQVAARVLDAIRAGEFWIITHPDERETVETRFATVLGGFPPTPAL